MEILNISLRSSTKFGSFPIGLSPAPEPEIGLPIVDHFSMPQWAKIQKKKFNLRKPLPNCLTERLKTRANNINCTIFLLLAHYKSIYLVFCKPVHFEVVSKYTEL